MSSQKELMDMLADSQAEIEELEDQVDAHENIQRILNGTQIIAAISLTANFFMFCLVVYMAVC